MPDEDGAGRATEPWLLETVRRTQQSVLSATGPEHLFTALPTALAAFSPHQFAWVGDIHNETVRIRTVAEDWTIEPATIPSGAETPTVRAAETGTVQLVSDITDNEEYQFLREAAGIPAATASIAIPIVVEGALYGVVHLYTDGTVTESPVAETCAELARMLADGISGLDTSKQLRRERHRLESVRGTISHDLGNPLNVAAGRLAIVRDEYESEHLGHIARALDSIEQLVDETVTYVSAGQPVETCHQLSLETVGYDCWQALETADSVIESTDTTIEGDPKRIRLLLTELFDNVVNHSSQPVTVTIGPLAGERGFYVADTGQGIPPDDHEVVFDWGYTTSPDRAGNGLALVSEIAEAHGWTIRLADGGSRFEFSTEAWTSADTADRMEEHDG